jgi:hypothetical protein
MKISISKQGENIENSMLHNLFWFGHSQMIVQGVDYYYNLNLMASVIRKKNCETSVLSLTAYCKLLR